MSSSSFSFQDIIDRVQGAQKPVARTIQQPVQRIARALQRRIKPTFDLAYYGKDLHIDLVDPTLTGSTTFTYSAAATVHRTTVHDFTAAGSSVNYVPLPHSTEKLLTTLDTALLVHEGDNTAFDQTYLIEADMTAALHQIQLSFAVAMNVASYTDATLALDSVSITLSSYMSSNSPITQPITKTIRPSSAFSALAAAGTHLFIIRDFLDIPMKLRVNGAMLMNIKINTTGSRGSDTYQVGLVDMYPIAKSTAAKRLYPSEIIVHIHPLPEHADELAKYTDFTIEGVND